MPLADQLEIIRLDGAVEFYDLSPAKGITNIGSHAQNDIVLPGDGVAPFHCVLDHRHQPYQLVVLDGQAPTLIDGRSLSGDQPASLNNWDTVEIGGHTVILLMGSPGGVPDTPRSSSPPLIGAIVPPSVESPTPAPARPAQQAPRIQSVPGVAPNGNGHSNGSDRQNGGASFAPALVSFSSGGRASGGQGDGHGGGFGGGAGSNGARYSAPLPFTPIVTPVTDHVDDLIIATLAEREVLVDVDTTVAFQLTVTNGGDLVSSFDVQLEGCDPSWVVILPAQMDLNEEESGIVTITVTPPRLPSSTAGRHYLAISITSPEYTDHYTQLGAVLNISPYFEVNIGELSRKKQASSYNNPTSESDFSIANNGNSPVQVQVEGRDDDRSLEFEFFLPNVNMTFARQAELRLGPSEGQEVTMFIEPHQRRLIGFRNKTYPFTITANPLGGQQFPRTIAGQVVSTPLIGKWTILSTFLLFLIGLLIIFSPGVYIFEVTPAVVRAGDTVNLSWEASRFAGVALSGGPDLLSVTPSPRGSIDVKPVRSTVYTVDSLNILSRLGLPALWPIQMTREVIVTPVPPEVRIAVDRDTVVQGESVVVAWQIGQADRATLFTNGNPRPLPTEEFIGSLAIEPNEDTTFRIEAGNPSVENPIGAQGVASVAVFTPTPTPLPKPGVLVFDVQPVTITEGEPVKIVWNVLNAPSVSIEGVGAELPPNGERDVFPTQNTTYVLRATTEGGNAFSQEVSVTVFPQPTATPLPNAPVIEFFRASPESVVQGDSQRITLTWSIKGNLTEVTIFNPDVPLNTTFTRTGQLPVTVNQTTFFILTAVNVDQGSTSQIDVVALEPTPTPEPTETATPVPPTATPVPNPNIIFFKLQSAATPPNQDEVKQVGTNEYEVVVGALLKVYWSVTSATSVLLDGFGTEPFEGEEIVQYDGSVSQYLLSTVNDPAGANGTSKSATIKVMAVTYTPSDPFNLSGSVDALGQNNISWSYASRDQQRISGFRIYRANVSDMNFAAVAEFGPLVTSFQDTALPSCGRAYFVVATFTDFRGDVFETGPSPTSWFSPGC